MRLSFGPMIILLGVVIWVPCNARAQSRDSASPTPVLTSSILLNPGVADISTATDSAAPFSLVQRAYFPDREVISCATGQKCVFFPDRRGEQLVARRSESPPNAAPLQLQQDPVTPASIRFASLGTTDVESDLPDSRIPKGESKPMKMPDESGFAWGPALSQSLIFLGIEHGIRVAFDPPTRDAMTGKFWKDYVSSLSSLKTWGDNNPAYINYLGHPMQGAITGYIQIQNDPKGKSLQFTPTREYWVSRLKALAWSAGYSAFFELGFPVSEAAVGNLGINRSPTSPKMGYVDIVITPTLGIAWVMVEDAIDTYLIRRLESSTQSETKRAILRSVLNPMRSAANVIRFKYPWYRDRIGP